MNSGEMVEYIKQHSPDISNTQAIKLIQRAADEFAQRTRIYEKTGTVTVLEDKRLYDLATMDGTLLEVRYVDYDGKKINRLTSRPNIRDLT